MHGENPLDFIKKNIAARAGVEIVPEESLRAEEEKRAAIAAQEEQKEETPTSDTPQKEPEASPVEEPTVTSPLFDKFKKVAQEEIKEEPKEEIVPEEPDKSIATNFKNVRKILNETKTQLTTKEKELQEAKAELEKYKTGEVMPDLVMQKEAEIARLSKYEKLLSLKTSPEYQEKYIKPLSTIKDQLTAIANDYRIPPAKLLGAVNVRNQADLNKFLSSHLDDGGFLEVKQLIKQAQGIQDQAQAAEQEPQEAMQKLLAEGEQARIQKMTAQRESIKTTTRSVWEEAYNDVKEEGKALELIYKEDDPEHNKKFVEPIVKQAATEFGKIVTMLAENGLEKLPKDLGTALAKAVLLAHASAVSLETRSMAVSQAEELLRHQARSARIYRPPVGYSSPGAETSPQTTKPTTPLEAGRTLINNVLASKRK